MPFDWVVVPAIVGQLDDPDPAWCHRLTEITAPKLLIAGGPSSHVPQDKLEELLAQLPRCTMLTIPVGHHVHAARPAEFAVAANCECSRPRLTSAETSRERSARLGWDGMGVLRRLVVKCLARP